MSGRGAATIFKLCTCRTSCYPPGVITNRLLKLCHLIITVSCIVVTASGCSPRGPMVVTPEDNERALFEEVRSFYCTEGRWPIDWGEFVQVVSNTAPSAAESANLSRSAMRAAKDAALAKAQLLQSFYEPSFATSRAILLTLTYFREPPEMRATSPESRRVSFIAPPVCGPDNDPKVVSIAGGRVIFALPEGFTVLGLEGIQERWKKPPFPDAAWSDPGSEVVIAVRFGEAALDTTGLSTFKRVIERAYQQSVPGLAWLRRSFDSTATPPRLQHEYESESTRGRLTTYSISLSFDSKLLTINVVGPHAMRNRVESVAKEIGVSLVVRNGET